jgi:hypothetical protein
MKVEDASSYGDIFPFHINHLPAFPLMTKAEGQDHVRVTLLGGLPLVVVLRVSLLGYLCWSLSVP